MSDALKLWGSVVVEFDAEALLDRLGEDLMAESSRAIAERGVFHLALSGGSTPEPFYRLLIIDPRFRGLPWERTHVWMVDERRVPLDHDKSNYRMIRETILDHVTMSRRNMHPVPVDRPDPGAAYEAELLRETLGESPAPDARPVLDFILLGMGDDAHTASLFPNSRALNEQDRWVVNNDGPGVTPPDRVTMTYRLINAARTVAVLCTGAKKRRTLETIDAQTRISGADTARYPITGVRPEPGRLTWYLDEEAAGVDTRIEL